MRRKEKFIFSRWNSAAEKHVEFALQTSLINVCAVRALMQQLPKFILCSVTAF